MGAVNTTYTFTATDTITSTKMNNIIDETVMTSSACLAGGGLEVASGQLAISLNAINSSRIANNAVTESAIANGSVTPAKLSPGAPSWGPGGVTFGTANMPNPDGNAPIYGCRAWAVISVSPRSILSGANVASATRIDATHTQITFTTAMPGDGYAVSGCVRNDGSLEFATYEHQTTGFKIRHSAELAGRLVQFMVIR